MADLDLEQFEALMQQEQQAKAVETVKQKESSKT